MADPTTSDTTTRRGGERPSDTTDHTEQMTHRDTRRRETNGAQTDADPSKRTLGEVSHTNPYTNRTFGTTQTYGRGPTVAADGGQAHAAPDDDENDEETLEDVDHTTNEDDVDGAQCTFDRGRTGPDDEPDEPDDE